MKAIITKAIQTVMVKKRHKKRVTCCVLTTDGIETIPAPQSGLSRKRDYQ